MKHIILHVEGMSCQHCVNSIEGALKNIGVSGTVDLENHSVEVTFDEDKITVNKINETIEEEGYEVL